MRNIAGLILLCAGLSVCALAYCNQPQPRLVCAEYFASVVVVEAKMIDSKYVDSDDKLGELDGHVYEMQTEKVLRGNIGPRFKVWEENSSGRAGFDWKLGQSYLLFLYTDKVRGWVLDGCGNSGLVSQAEKTLTQIGAIRGARGGMIQVAIGGNNLAYAVEGADVRASNSKATFSATTNKQGVAEIHVSPGAYRVSVSSKEIVIPSDITYSEPDKVVIENGGCAQIQFVARQ